MKNIYDGIHSLSFRQEWKWQIWPALRSTPELLVFLIGTCVAAIPDGVTALPTQILADIFIGIFLCILLARLRFDLRVGKGILIILFLVAGFGLMASIVSSDGDAYSFALSMRYLVYLPVVYFLVGVSMHRRFGEWFWVWLIPALVFNVSLMSWAVQYPFVGHTETKFISEEGRYFMFPIGEFHLLRPVGVSEACSYGFAGLFMGWIFQRTYCGRILIALSFVAIVLALVTATRTYLFGLSVMLFVCILLSPLRVKIRLSGFTLVFLIIGISVFWLLFRNTELMLLAQERLSRFYDAGDLLNTSGRFDIWSYRIVDIQEGVSLIYGLGMLQYRLTYGISSHNMFVDLALIGGFAYFVSIAILFLIVLNRSTVYIIRYMGRSEAGLSLACWLYTIVFTVSSPILSSKQTFGTALIVFGALMVSGPVSRIIQSECFRSLDDDVLSRSRRA